METCTHPGCKYTAKTKGAITLWSLVRAGAEVVFRYVAIEAQDLESSRPTLLTQHFPEVFAGHAPRFHTGAFTESFAVSGSVTSDVINGEESVLLFAAAGAAITVRLQQFVKQFRFPSRVVDTSFFCRFRSM